MRFSVVQALPNEPGEYSSVDSFLGALNGEQRPQVVLSERQKVTVLLNVIHRRINAKIYVYIYMYINIISTMIMIILINMHMIQIDISYI